MMDAIHVYLQPSLKALIAKAADRENLPMSEWVTRAVAERFGRPKLGIAIRKRPGRRRKKIVGP